MKTIIDYLQEHKTYKHDVIGREFELKLYGHLLTISFDGNKWCIDIRQDPHVDWTVRDVFERKCKIEIRFCEECGKPIDEGFLIDDGSFYSCEDCFEVTMDKRYGKDNWRATDQEGEWGGYYECMYNGVWEDTGIFWTQWY